ncbi:MAG: hypothetical protein WCV70_01900 [Patescibacteria group bacterium]|jgi:hypothetical protein
MKKIFLISLIFCLISPNIAKSAALLAGRILLQIEEKGQAWYVHPENQTRYYLGTPTDAFNLMRKLSIGISDKDLTKIPIGISDNNYPDSDSDGLYDNLEDAIGTDKQNKDTDNDSYNDKEELDNGYNPLGEGKQPVDKKFTQKNSGKIFLQVEKNGEAWYVEPLAQKRYFLGRPADAFKIMKNFGLGITNADLQKIPISLLLINDIQNTDNPAPITTTGDVMQLAAAAIRKVNIEQTLLYFTPNMHKSIEYSLRHMRKEDLLILANILSGSSLQSTTENKKAYFNEVYFQNEKHQVYFYVEKQPDGKWLITNL